MCSLIRFTLDHQPATELFFFGVVPRLKKIFCFRLAARIVTRREEKTSRESGGNQEDAVGKYDKCKWNKIGSL